MKYGLCAMLVALAWAGRATAAVIVSEVAPWGSGDAPYAADWFELTNTGASTVDITGWKVDDSIPTFATAVALRGVTSIAAGQSVVFVESNASGSNDATITAGFIADRFPGGAPSGFAIGAYGGSGIGLSTGGDAVNLFDSGGALVSTASVSFGASTGAPTGKTFDNAAGLTGALTTLSASGVNGAFLSASGDTGSPGTIGVPEPASLAMLGVAGVALLAARRRR